MATPGYHIRAEALAAPITDPDRRARALAAVAGALAEADQHKQVETVARSITDPYELAGGPER